MTTSWDDGDPQDLRVAELLDSRGLKGTFYVPIIGYDGRRILEPAELRSLASGGFEIGAHGVSHNVLTGLNTKELAREVRVCKSRLEEILSKPVQMFCYPKGKYDARVVQQVKLAGYKGARTARMLSQKLAFSPYQMPTSLQAQRDLKKRYVKNLTRAMNIRGLYAYATHYISLNNWVEVGKALFGRVLREGGVWHLYGHSWAIEELGMWGDVAQMLDYVCQQEGVLYLSNVDVLKFCNQQEGVVKPMINGLGL